VKINSAQVFDIQYHDGYSNADHRSIYTVDENGVVTLAFKVKSDSALAIGTRYTVATLPLGARPITAVHFPIFQADNIAFANGSHCNAWVQTDGKIYLVPAIANGIYFGGSSCYIIAR